MFSAPLNDGSTTAGDQAVELAAAAGLHLFPWQQVALRAMLAERADGKWAAFESALMVPRQNGKGSVIEAYELANLFLFDAQLILHSAHLFPTAQEAFRRLDGLIDGAPSLRRLVHKISNSHGSEGIELKSGARIRFMARTVTGAGRGFTPDRLVLDEAFRLPPEAVAAVLPALSAQPNPQILYTSSTGYPDSDVLWRLAERGRKGGDASLAYLEWSAEPAMDVANPDTWAVSNPSLGFLFDTETIARERATLTDEDFARERLGLWAEVGSDSVVDFGQWQALVDPESKADCPSAFGIEVTRDRAAHIGVAGSRSDGLWHVESVKSGRGTDWVVARCVELNVKFDPVLFVIDSGGLAVSLIPELESAGLKVVTTTTRQVVQGCGQFVDAVNQSTLRHGPQPDLDMAVFGAKRRDLGDGAYAFGRKASGVDIGPLNAVMLALWAAIDATNLSLHPVNNVW